MENIEMLINDLESEVVKAKRAAFSSTDVVVNRGVILDIISRLRANLPAAIKEAMAITAQRDDILSRAEAYANETMDKAEQHAQHLIDEAEIVKQANERVAAMNAEAEENYRRVDYDARKHGFQLLESVESVLRDALGTIAESKNNLIQS